MAASYDLIVRNGTVIDGTGAEPREADVAIQDGRIAAVGTLDGSAREEIDARGFAVTPGFVDIHTHYDGQVTWDDRFSPSSGHGVTTVLMGNCGVGFAPCRPEDRDTLMNVMEGVEDIPELVMREGVPWNWQSFPDYLDALSTRQCDIDFATQVPHAPLRVFVMGRRGVDREPANASDMVEMSRLVEEGLSAGALGFSTSRSLFHRTPDGALTPTITAGEEELAAIARGMRRAGKGVIQLLDDFADTTAEGATEFAMLRRLVELSAGRCPSPCSTSRSIPDAGRRSCVRSSARIATACRSAARSRRDRSPCSTGWSFHSTPSRLARATARSRGCRSRPSSPGCAIRR
jgi:N-acyl-D-amino-acid deacylase